MIPNLRKYLGRVKGALGSTRKRPEPGKKHIFERVYSIGIYSGESPWSLGPKGRRVNPVLTRDSVHGADVISVADPFMLRVDGRWHMFFEIHDRKDGKGRIGLAVSKDCKKWEYRGVVLDEPFHLSYPHVFEWQGDFFMVPESHEAESVRLYRCESFPTKWVFVKTLLEKVGYVDSSVVHHNGLWWLFTSDGSSPFKADDLHLFYAEDLLGEWVEHPKSPIVREDRRIARPAGRILSANGCLYRYAQDCSTAYGTQVFALKIDELSKSSYREQEVAEQNPVLSGSGRGWNRQGMHHIDIHRLSKGGFLACVDGWVMRERSA